jgi:hypothetical protein
MNISNSKWEHHMSVGGMLVNSLGTQRSPTSKATHVCISLEGGMALWICGWMAVGLCCFFLRWAVAGWKLAT